MVLIRDCDVVGSAESPSNDDRTVCPERVGEVEGKVEVEVGPVVSLTTSSSCSIPFSGVGTERGQGVSEVGSLGRDSFSFSNRSGLETLVPLISK